MKKAEAILEVKLRFPEVERFLNGKRERELARPLLVEDRYELVRLAVDPRDAELAIRLHVRVGLARCDMFDAELEKLRDLVEQRLLPYLLGHLFADYDLGILDVGKDAAVEVVGRDCPEEATASATGRKFLLTGGLLLTLTPHVGVVKHVDTDLLVKVSETLLARATVAKKEELEDLEELLRIARWYARGQHERDYIDRFVDWWIALEAWASYYYEHKLGEEPRGEVKVAEKLRRALERSELCPSEDIVKEVYSTRSALFHRGIEERVARDLPALQACVRRVVEWVREELRAMLST